MDSLYEVGKDEKDILAEEMFECAWWVSETLSHPVWLEHGVLECGYRDEQQLSYSN